MESPYAEFIKHETGDDNKWMVLSSELPTLNDFQKFLRLIIYKYGPIVALAKGKYTVFKRIVDLKNYVEHPTFALALSQELSIKFLQMLLSNNPFEVSKALL